MDEYIVEFQHFVWISDTHLASYGRQLGPFYEYILSRGISLWQIFEHFQLGLLSMHGIMS